MTPPTGQPRIGVLALQGAVLPHKAHIEALDALFCMVKTADDLAHIDALILPGGESTTMLKLIGAFDLEKDLRHVLATRPVWGICAGAILIAQTVLNPTQKSFGMIPMTVIRNAYGRQIESRFMDVQGANVAFIRAPVIETVSKDVDIRAAHAGKPIWVRHKNAMATSFHPELSSGYPSPMHRFFIEEMVRPHRNICA